MSRASNLLMKKTYLCLSFCNRKSLAKTRDNPLRDINDALINAIEEVTQQNEAYVNNFNDLKKNTQETSANNAVENRFDSNMITWV